MTQKMGHNNVHYSFNEHFNDEGEEEEQDEPGVLGRLIIVGRVYTRFRFGT